MPGTSLSQPKAPFVIRLLRLSGRVCQHFFLSLHLLTLRCHSRRYLARIAREHHIEEVRRHAWLLTGAFVAGTGTYFNPGILVVVGQWGQLVADLGERVAIAPGVMFIGTSSPCNDTLFQIDGFVERFVRTSPIKVKDDAWIGAGVIILPGVTIGAAALVGAGAVVTRDVPDYAVVAGVPARIIGDVRSANITRPSSGAVAS